jgi:hypothetical protein
MRGLVLSVAGVSNWIRTSVRLVPLKSRAASLAVALSKRFVKVMLMFSGCAGAGRDMARPIESISIAPSWFLAFESPGITGCVSM